MRPGLLRAAACGYRQGQRPEPGTREYFYYIDHRGQLFLDDAKVKNFITCFKDERFLTFFFERLRPNRSGRYEAAFPYVSPCGRERNFVRCEDRPVVFTRLLPAADTTNDAADAEPPLLSYCGGGRRLAVPFEPPRLALLPDNGRLYHPAPARAGGVGLVGSALAAEWSQAFEYGEGAGRPPTHFTWRGRRYELSHELLPLLRHGAPGERGGCGDAQGLGGVGRG
uniref:Chromosome 8 open reading frame 82 n=1 Tax=Anser brachyrhynchus TaxID=132585 RepID=A0A8B9CTL2_9AVES